MMQCGLAKASKMGAGMGDYIYRITNAALGSEFMPAFLRRSIMRSMGFDFSKKSAVWSNCSFRSRKVSIASGVFINVGFYHDGFDWLTISDNVRIGPFVRVITATHDIGPSSQRGMLEVVGKPVHIAEACWIGSGVTILPGVTIARSCVIAAGAVVYESTDVDGLYAGNPAKRVRDLEP
jgi:maltose O-acetyltransferase